MRKLFGQHPNADTELHFTTPYELLVATILSAQCTDERVNQVTPSLFRRYPDARSLARATTGELEPQIKPTGFFRAKSRSLVGMATAVVDQHAGEIPGTMSELVKLPGVGRKTANVVLGHALGVPGLPVDRHVLRVANRIGLVSSEDPEIVEQQLGAAMPSAEWTLTSDSLILHGRRICKPRPLCDRCAVRDDCDYYRSTLGAVSKKGSKKRAAKPRASRGSERLSKSEAAIASRAESGSLMKLPRAAKPEASRGGGGTPQNRSESGSLAKLPRAAKPRATGAGVGHRRTVLKADR